ncbi:Magnesium and cobalt transport protein CorA [Planctomycetales bacterium 10988]|nr:Magnesium and cobalt transport protein CorA [Planctomycetales bacterium 10988]
MFTALIPNRLMRFRRARRNIVPGEMPGTLRPSPESEPTKLKIVQYDGKTLNSWDSMEFSELRSLYEDKQKVLWVHVTGLADIPLLRQLGELFDLHRLALEDLLSDEQQSKVEEYDEHLFLVEKIIAFEQGLEADQLGLFLGHNFVLTFCERSRDRLQPLHDRLRRNHGILRNMGADYLAYAILDSVIDLYFPVLQKYGETLDRLEDEMFKDPSHDLLIEAYEIRRQLRQMRRWIWPSRDAIGSLVRKGNDFFSDETRLYLRDCYDHAIQIIGQIDTQRDLATDLREFYLSMASNRMNEVMKVLTIIATIFIPLSFITGLYGMNFNPEISNYNMPELQWRYGYPFALSMMALLAACLMGFFISRGWLRRG